VKNSRKERGIALASIILLIIVFILIAVSVVGLTTMQSRYSLKSYQDIKTREVAVAGARILQDVLSSIDNWSEVGTPGDGYMEIGRKLSDPNGYRYVADKEYNYQTRMFDDYISELKILDVRNDTVTATSKGYFVAKTQNKSEIRWEKIYRVVYKKNRFRYAAASLTMDQYGIAISSNSEIDGDLCCLTAPPLIACGIASTTDSGFVNTLFEPPDGPLPDVPPPFPTNGKPQPGYSPGGLLQPDVNDDPITTQPVSPLVGEPPPNPNVVPGIYATEPPDGGPPQNPAVQGPHPSTTGGADPPDFSHTHSNPNIPHNTKSMSEGAGTSQNRDPRQGSGYDYDTPQIQPLNQQQNGNGANGTGVNGNNQSANAVTELSGRIYVMQNQQGVAARVDPPSFSNGRVEPLLQAPMSKIYYDESNIFINYGNPLSETVSLPDGYFQAHASSSDRSVTLNAGSYQIGEFKVDSPLVIKPRGGTVFLFVDVKLSIAKDLEIQGDPRNLIVFYRGNKEVTIGTPTGPQMTRVTNLFLEASKATVRITRTDFCGSLIGNKILIDNSRLAFPDYLRGDREKGRALIISLEELATSR